MGLIWLSILSTHVYPFVSVAIIDNGEKNLPWTKGQQMTMDIPLQLRDEHKASILIIILKNTEYFGNTAWNPFFVLKPNPYSSLPCHFFMRTNVLYNQPFHNVYKMPNQYLYQQQSYNFTTYFCTRTYTQFKSCNAHAFSPL